MSDDVKDSETVYERARQAFWRVERGDYGHNDDKTILAAIDAGEAAEKRAEDMAKAIAGRCWEHRPDRVLQKIIDRAEAAERERDEERTRADNAENDAHDATREMAVAQARVAECEALLSRCSPKMDPPKE